MFWSSAILTASSTVKRSVAGVFVLWAAAGRAGTAAAASKTRTAVRMMQVFSKTINGLRLPGEIRADLPARLAGAPAVLGRRRRTTNKQQASRAASGAAPATDRRKSRSRLRGLFRNRL